MYTINPRASIFLKRKTKRFSYQENRGDKLEYQNILDLIQKKAGKGGEKRTDGINE